jgi:hypothetical protein
MTQLVEPTPVQAPVETDLAAAVHRVLAASPEPLTPAKIRAHLPAALRGVSPEELAECLHRQVAANVLCQYPKYRSQQDRYWDRSMPVHVAALLRQTLQEGPLAWSELRRKLPAYALVQAEAVLMEQVAQGLLYRHPRAGKRGSDRFGVQPADPKVYLRAELAAVLRNLAQLGFSESQLREGALELLHDEEWSPASPQPPAPESAPEAARPETAAATPPAEAGREPSTLPTGNSPAIAQAETHPDAPDAGTL